MAAKKWGHILLYNPFVWVTDSESMARRLRSAHLSGAQRITNTMIDLSEFSFDTLYAPGWT